MTFTNCAIGPVGVAVAVIDVLIADRSGVEIIGFERIGSEGQDGVGGGVGLGGEMVKGLRREVQVCLKERGGMTC